MQQDCQKSETNNCGGDMITEALIILHLQDHLLDAFMLNLNNHINSISRLCTMHLRNLCHTTKLNSKKEAFTSVTFLHEYITYWRFEMRP